MVAKNPPSAYPLKRVFFRIFVEFHGDGGRTGEVFRPDSDPVFSATLNSGMETGATAWKPEPRIKTDWEIGGRKSLRNASLGSLRTFVATIPTACAGHRPRSHLAAAALPDTTPRRLPCGAVYRSWSGTGPVPWLREPPECIFGIVALFRGNNPDGMRRASATEPPRSGGSTRHHTAPERTSFGVHGLRWGAFFVTLIRPLFSGTFR